MEIKKVPGHTNYLTTLKKISGLSDEENAIIQKKYASKQIGMMDATEVMFATKNLLLKIHVITGWTLPMAEIMTVLKDVFQKKLVEDYPMLNVDEIEYAFIKSGTTTEDWGKEVNLNLIDKILIPYVVKRMECSIEEEKKKPSPEQKIYSDEEIMNQRRAEIETAYQAMRQGNYPIIHHYFANVLLQDGFIAEGVTAEEFFVNALGLKVDNIYTREDE
jgi:hypothetical protein